MFSPFRQKSQKTIFQRIHSRNRTRYAYFGRDLKWNPHVHALCTQGADDRNGFWHHFTCIDYKYLHIVFMQKLIALLRKRFKGNKEFHKLSCQIYKDHPDGFHVHVDRIEKVTSDKDATSPLRKTIKYIGRYFGRPPIAMSRIDNFDEETHRGTFHTTPHELHEELAPGEPMFETLHMLCFAMRLIRHKRVTLSLSRQGHFH